MGAWGRGTPWIPGCKAGETTLLSHNPSTFDFYPGEEARECPQPSARSRRAPDSSALGGRPSRAGVGEAGSCSFRTRPGLMHHSCLGQIRGLLHPYLHFPEQGSSRHAVLGPLLGQDLHPTPTPPESPTVSNRNGVRARKRLPAVLRWRQGACQGCCLRPHPASVGRKVPGKSQVLLRWALERPSHFSVHCALFWVEQGFIVTVGSLEGQHCGHF